MDCHKQQYFKNPNLLPLNELFIERKTIKRYKRVTKDLNLDKISKDLKKYLEIRTENIAALDDDWIPEKYTFYEYQPYYCELSVEDNNQFVEKNKLFIESLKYVLERSYHHFWCLLLFERQIMFILDSFIHNPMSVYDLQQLPPEFLEVQNICTELVGKIYGRMLLFSESKTEYMSEDTVERYLLDYEIITYPKIISLCLIYNETSRQFVDQLIKVFFNVKYKSLYDKELKKLMEHTLSVFDLVGGQVCGFEEKMAFTPSFIRTKPINFDPFWYEEVTAYLMDTALNLNAFLSVCMQARNMAFEMGIPFRLTYFYNRVYHELYTILKRKWKVPFDWTSLKERIFKMMSAGRKEFVAVFHSIVGDSVDKIVQCIGDNKKQEEHVESYFKLISTALEDEYFIFDYHNANGIDVQVQLLVETCQELDQTRTNYILECLGTLPNSTELLKPKPVPKKAPEAAAGPSKHLPVQTIPEKGKKPNADELQELISSVLDTLPHLGDGFVEKCLEHYNYDTAEVISAILDENLATNLMSIPPDMIRIPDEPKPAPPILAYKGKKPGYSDANQLLNDKSDMQATKEFVLKKSMVSYDIYDDDYDDRDDLEHDICLERNEEPDIYKYMQNRFDNYKDDGISTPSDSEDESKATNGQSQAQGSYQNRPSSGKPNGFQAFCEDPALVRERREANRKNHHQSRDVVGKPKGQGQDAKVLQSRDKKNVNKSSRANHNRKSGAQFKRNKGMMPS